MASWIRFHSPVTRFRQKSSLPQFSDVAGMEACTRARHWKHGGDEAGRAGASFRLAHRRVDCGSRISGGSDQPSARIWSDRPRDSSDAPIDREADAHPGSVK